MAFIPYAHKEIGERTSHFEESNVTKLSVPDVRTVRLVSLGFDQLLADFYWLKFVGYIGDSPARRLDGCSLARPYLELITALDPYFLEPYWFAAFTIGGDMQKPAEAAQLIEWGLQNNQDNWYLPFIAGLNQFLFAKNEVTAAKFYRMAARFPDAPSWLLRQADILETETPRQIKTANSWLQIYDSAQEPSIKEKAKLECIRLYVRIYKTAPNEKFKQNAKSVLSYLGVDIDAIAPVTTPRNGTK